MEKLAGGMDMSKLKARFILNTVDFAVAHKMDTAGLGLVYYCIAQSLLAKSKNEKVSETTSAHGVRVSRRPQALNTLNFSSEGD